VALCREQGNVWTGAFQLQTLAHLANKRGNVAEAEAYLQQSLRLFKEVGFKPGQANVLENLGQLRESQGNFAAARAHYEACLALRRLMGGAQQTADVLEQLELVARGQGDYPAAQAFAQEREHWLAPVETTSPLRALRGTS